MPDIIDFESSNERRINAGIRTDEEYWHNIRDQLVTIMADAELTDATLTSATLNALMAMLEADGNMTFPAVS
jgi:hypothetical protein